MKIKFFCLLIGCFLMTSVFSQANLNNYKYVIVAKRFDFLKESNQYRINELAQFLFNKYGFEAVMEGEDYPEDLIKNRCLGLKADVLKDSGLFKTKLNVVLKDCNDKTIYTSEVGESRQKDYDKAYAEALRNAFNSFDSLNYKYEANEKNVALGAASTKNEVATEIQQLKQELETLKKEKEVEDTAAQPKVEVVKTVPVDVEKIKEPIRQVAISKPVITNGVLYAQATENGFQLVDSSPKVVYKIIKTGANNVFLVENSKAIIYKEDNKWFLENSENGKAERQELQIKF